MYEDTEWQDPTSIKDAENRKDKTIAMLFNIDAQLNNKQLTDEDGNRLDSHAYQARRAKLLKQKSHILRDLKHLRHWIRNARDASSADNKVLPDNALLRKAYELFAQLRDDGVDFEDHELEFIDVLAARVGA
jgi:hypothetical protein